MSNNIEKKRKFLQFQLSNRFSNTMPNALYQALNNPSRKTENCAYRINKYVSENQNFVSEFYIQLIKRACIYLMPHRAVGRHPSLCRGLLVLPVKCQNLQL